METGFRLRELCPLNGQVGSPLTIIERKEQCAPSDFLADMHMHFRHNPRNNGRDVDIFGPWFNETGSGNRLRVRCAARCHRRFDIRDRLMGLQQVPAHEREGQHRDHRTIILRDMYGKAIRN